MTELVERYGEEITIENCIVGNNLNLSVVRGFARMDVLANISAPDIYDPATNPEGTQRDLIRIHGMEAYEYALEAVSFTADSNPRAFPEVLLNARDRSVLSIISEGENSGEIDFLSLDPMEEIPRYVNLKVHTRQIEWPQPGRDPQISRVDGNHRLSQVELSVGDDSEEYPIIPFAMFVGLSADQERALFRDINATQRKMETAHLDTIRLKLTGPLELFKTEGGRALWIAQQLAEAGRAFEGKVFFGGSKKGTKAADGSVPPIRINTLKSAVATTMRDMTRIEEEFFSNENLDGTIREISESDALQVLTLIDRFWKAVALSYPQAWQDRAKFILLQAIGLTAFSRLAADVIKTQFFDETKVSQEDFNNVLRHIAGQVDLSRENFPGLAGLAGAREVYKKLASALNSQAIAVSAIKKQLADEISQSPSPLDQ